MVLIICTGYASLINTEKIEWLILYDRLVFRREWC